jgi:O-antigen ligase
MPQAPHSWLGVPGACVVALGFVMPMGEDATPQLLNDPRITVGVAGAAVIACGFSLLSTRGNGVGPHSAFATRLGLVYLAVISLATLTRELPEARLQLFALFPVGLLCFYCLERRRAGEWLDAVFLTGVLHVFWALLVGDRTLIASGVERLSGGTHPVLLGFESAAVIVLSLRKMYDAPRTRIRLSLLAIMVASTYTLLGAFSRAALIALAAALLIWLATSSGRAAGLKLVYTGLGGFAVYVVGWPFLLDFLGGADPDSVLTASGRYEIWPRLLGAADEPFRGYGFLALYDGEGPDWYLFYLNGGLPAENSAIEAYLMAGIVGAATWLILLLGSWRAAWQARGTSRGLSVSFAILISVDAMYGVGMSGVSSSWWWLLGSFALADRESLTTSKGAVGVSKS